MFSTKHFDTIPSDGMDDWKFEVFDAFRIFNKLSRLRALKRNTAAIDLVNIL